MSDSAGVPWGEGGMLAACPDYQPYVPGAYVPPPKAECGHCHLYQVGGEQRVGPDSECPVHGIDAHPHAWRTPDAYREGRFTDEAPEPPRMTFREAEHGEDRLRYLEKRAARYGS